ncbi:MAG: DUF1631 family protein [Arenimonas sp.]
MSAHASQSQLLPTLALQPLPHHVRELLQRTLKTCANALEGNVQLAIKDLEQQVLQEVSQTIDIAPRERLRKALQEVAHARSDLVNNFMRALEGEIAMLHSPVAVRGHMTARFDTASEMSLVNDQEIEETSALTDAASRAELQSSLPLFLLGQRFGVLAGRPAFDAESLPIGPQALCRSIRRAVERINLDVNIRLMLYRCFERKVMRDYGSLLALVNTDLARNGVLPNLQYVPVRARRTEQNPGAVARAGTNAGLGDHNLKLAAGPSPQGDDASGARPARSDPRAPRSEAETRAKQSRQAAQLLLAMAATHGGALASDEGYQVLRQLMSGRRQLLGKLSSVRSREGREATAHVVSGNDLQEALRGLQTRPPAPVMSRGRAAARNIGHLKQDMLALLRRGSPDQQAPALSEEHSDAIDLVGMLYENLGREVKPGTAVSNMLTKLQVPMMRVALQDQTFFTRQDHPARQMLNAIAETGANWVSEDESDTALVGQMNSIVDRAVNEYRGDPDVFHNVLNELMGHLQTLSRKAEVAERRHVGAAQGKEKLTLAREHANDSVESLVKGQKLPRFTRTMLSQAWADVMALTALRQGQDSPQWQQQLKVAERLIEIAQKPARAPTEVDDELLRDIEDGLSKVGYQEADVGKIARRLLNPNATEDDDDAASSRTELTLRLKAQARLGEDLQGKKAKRIPLTSTEQVQLERLQQIATGTIFDFSTPEGESSRRRLAWFSPATGATLFVNHRGQKFTDQTMDSLARLMAKGLATPVEEQKGTVIDRAWENVLNALRSFAVPEEPGAPA